VASSKRSVALALVVAVLSVAAGALLSRREAWRSTVDDSRVVGSPGTAPTPRQPGGRTELWAIPGVRMCSGANERAVHVAYGGFLSIRASELSSVVKFLSDEGASVADSGVNSPRTGQASLGGCDVCWSSATDGIIRLAVVPSDRESPFGVIASEFSRLVTGLTSRGLVVGLAPAVLRLLVSWRQLSRAIDRVVLLWECKLKPITDIVDGYLMEISAPDGGRFRLYMNIRSESDVELGVLPDRDAADAQLAVTLLMRIVDEALGSGWCLQEAWGGAQYVRTR
jgi:hypothetical protein